MRFGKIDIPKPLCDAQQAGELVVFAGAGVSIPEPSNYPNFDDLADQIANGTLTRQGNPLDREPVDRFLGRLSDRGTKIHEIAKRILSDPKSRPNPLHRHLLKLFDGEQKVRLVTTNFDDHFVTTSRDEPRNSLLKIYCAPALPPGDSFTGLVHLHGSVREHENSLVLTDRDFGRAYLTEGWARRFLQSVFTQFTVLFVGYSHNDPVMNYLARGLTSRPSGPSRYAITESGKEEHWEYLGIQPLTYPADQHKEIEITLGRWSSQALMGPIDHNAKIKDIVEKPVPLVGEERDYITACLLDASKTRYFTQHAENLDWLDWIEDQAPFARLFHQNRSFSEEEAEISKELAYWFGRKFAFLKQDAAMNVLLRKNGSLGPLLWSAIAHSVFLERPAVEQLRRWVPVLIQTRPVGFKDHFLGNILCNYLNRSDPSVALLLFGSLLRPTAQLERGFRMSNQGEDLEPGVDLELETIGEWYSLNQAWGQFFSQNIGEYAEFLIPMVTAHLQEATLLMRLHEKIYTGFDLVTLSMNGVGGPEPGLSHSGMGVLVHAAKETLDWIVVNRPSQAMDLISSWWSADSLILKKLAVHGVASCKTWKADARLRWILQRQLVFFPGLRGEVAKAVSDTYRQSSSRTKKRLLRTILTGPETGKNDSVEHRVHRIYSLLLILAEASPECTMVADSIVKIRKEYPFLPGPEVTYLQPPGWPGSAEPVSSLKKTELLAKPPAHHLNDLLSLYQGEDFKPLRAALLSEVEDAIGEKNDWGILLAQELRNHNLWASDLWWALIEGFNQSRVSIMGRGQFLKVLAECPEILPYATNSVLRLLEHGIAKKEEAIDGEILELASRVAESLWPSLATSDEKRMDTAEEWLSVAINHDAGILMEVHLSVLGKIRQLRGDGWEGIPEEVKTHLRIVVDGPSWASEMARILLASQVHFLFSLDPAWVEDSIFKLFDWEADERRALQAWHGYLFWGKWSNETIEKFMRFYTMTWKRLDLLSKRPRRQLLQHLAAIAVFGILDPVQSGWLTSFIKDVEQKDRAEWASSIGVVLRQATSDSGRKIWQSWMKDYWQSRLDGSPAPLSASEVEEMVTWAVELDTVFPEVALFFQNSPQSEPNHRFVYTTLTESAIPQNHPQALADFLVWLLRAEKTLPYDFDKIHAMVKSIAANVQDRTRLVAICNELMRLGDLGAAKLKSEIE